MEPQRSPNRRRGKSSLLAQEQERTNNESLSDLVSLSRDASDYNSNEQYVAVNSEAEQCYAVPNSVPVVSDAIKVICRFRPPRSTIANAPAGSVSMGRQSLSGRHSLSSNQTTHDFQGQPFRLGSENSTVDYSGDFGETKTFKFDKVFDSNTTQVEVFEEVKGVVDSVMSGFNGTVMAYGQTSAGKSWTMDGASIWERETQGVIPRCVDALFECIQRADNNIQFTVIISFYEVYCEKIRDLLNPQPQQCNLKLRETKTDGFVVQDLTEVYCVDKESVLRTIEMGKTNRASAPTLMNAESSRSHSIVSITVGQQAITTGRKKKGSLYLVDLAGSEKISKTGATGMRLEEAKNINSSLTTLGMVINALCEGGGGHVPYRDSKLTLILMEALGGNSKTTLIICCTPESTHAAESLSTLRFGERAKKIKNNAKVNEELSPRELKNLLALAKREIATLKKRLSLFEGEAPSSRPPLMRSGSQSSVSQSQSQSDEDDNVTVNLLEDVAAEEKWRAMLEDAKQENSSLQLRIVSVEEDLEAERAKFEEERVGRLQALSECSALQNTITELESKLIKVSMEGKRSVSATPAHKMPSSATRGSPDNENAVPVAQTETHNASSSESTAVGAEKDILQGMEGVTTIEVDLEDDDFSPSNSPFASTIRPILSGRPAAAASVSPSVALANAAQMLSSQDEDLVQGSVEDPAASIQRSLEAEISFLGDNLTQQESDVREAQQTAHTYAEKYVRLRQDYESHVQRLMYKLTQEQQARTQTEDRLEDALSRLWTSTQRKNSSSSGSGGFLSALFSNSGASNASHSTSRRKMSSSGQDFGQERARNSSSDFNMQSSGPEREEQLTRSLDLTKIRVSQLMSELEAIKEANIIVLETKESVMRSLARQNSQLTVERDNLTRRVGDMSVTVDQLTNLLRSIQTRKYSPVMTGSNMGSASSSFSSSSSSSSSSNQIRLHPPNIWSPNRVVGVGSSSSSDSPSYQTATVIRGGGGGATQSFSIR